MLDNWNAGKIPMLVAHPASVGHGLNLQHGGSTIVWMTLTYSRELYEQMIARLARRADPLRAAQARDGGLGSAVTVSCTRRAVGDSNPPACYLEGSCSIHLS